MNELKNNIRKDLVPVLGASAIVIILIVAGVVK